MKLNYKYVIGTHVMFYEADLLKAYMEGIKNAVDMVNEESRENITFNFKFNFQEHFEKIDINSLPDGIVYIENKIVKFINKLIKLGVNVEYSYLHNSDTPYGIADYRREFNNKWCTKADYLIWGETDALFPKQTFEVLEIAKNYAIDQNINKFILTFATRKMWDNTWTPLEFEEFANKQYYESDNPKAKTEPHSIRYVMDVNEMNELNSHADSYNLKIINKPKFDGSLLVISSDLVKGGANIPRGVIGISGEDEAFMYSCEKIMKNNYIQFVIKNIMKVHNRAHPDKRNYAISVNNNKTEQNNKGDFYKKIRKISKKNVYNFARNSQTKFINYDEMLRR